MNVSATFSETVDPSTISESTFELRDSSNAIVSAQISYDSGAKTATLNPVSILSPVTRYTATIKGGANGVKDLAGNPMESDVTWAFTTTGLEYTIWNDGTVPQQYDAVSDDVPIEVGVKFRTDANGNIAGLRFYKGLANTGTHVGNLWDSSGVLLAEVTFTNELASGWQEALFATVVPIVANTTYVASYYSSSGYFAMDAGYFTTAGVDNGPLHALANGVDGGNGVYRYNASGFPDQSGSGRNYWVDVIFQPTP